MNIIYLVGCMQKTFVVHWAVRGKAQFMLSRLFGPQHGHGGPIEGYCMITEPAVHNLGY